MTIEYKYFQITEKETLDHIEHCLLSIGVRNKAIQELVKELGARECFQWNRGGIASFSFNARPDKAIWKKVKHGYMPKVKTEEYKLINSLPESIDYRDIIKKYSFGGEMILGEPTRPSGGFPMISSGIQGSRKNNFYVIKVPYQGEFDREVDKSLLEIKEWEMMKGIDEGDSK